MNFANLAQIDQQLTYKINLNKTEICKIFTKLSLKHWPLSDPNSSAILKQTELPCLVEVSKTERDPERIDHVGIESDVARLMFGIILDSYLSYPDYNKLLNSHIFDTMIWDRVVQPMAVKLNWVHFRPFVAGMLKAFIWNQFPGDDEMMTFATKTIPKSWLKAAQKIFILHDLDGTSTKQLDKFMMSPVLQQSIVKDVIIEMLRLEAGRMRTVLYEDMDSLSQQYVPADDIIQLNFASLPQFTTETFSYNVQHRVYISLVNRILLLAKTFLESETAPTGVLANSFARYPQLRTILFSKLSEFSNHLQFMNGTRHYEMHGNEIHRTRLTMLAMNIRDLFMVSQIDLFDNYYSRVEKSVGIPVGYFPIAVSIGDDHSESIAKFIKVINENRLRQRSTESQHQENPETPFLDLKSFHFTRYHEFGILPEFKTEYYVNELQYLTNGFDLKAVKEELNGHFQSVIEGTKDDGSEPSVSSTSSFVSNPENPRRALRINMKSHEKKGKVTIMPYSVERQSSATPFTQGSLSEATRKQMTEICQQLGSEPISLDDMFTNLKSCLLDSKMFALSSNTTAPLLVTDRIEGINTAGIENFRLSLDGLAASKSIKSNEDETLPRIFENTVGRVMFNFWRSWYLSFKLLRHYSQPFIIANLHTFPMGVAHQDFTDFGNRLYRDGILSNSTEHQLKTLFNGKVIQKVIASRAFRKFVVGVLGALHTNIHAMDYQFHVESAGSVSSNFPVEDENTDFSHPPSETSSSGAFGALSKISLQPDGTSRDDDIGGHYEDESIPLLPSEIAMYKAAEPRPLSREQSVYFSASSNFVQSDEDSDSATSLPLMKAKRIDPELSPKSLQTYITENKPTKALLCTLSFQFARQSLRRLFFDFPYMIKVRVRRLALSNQMSKALNILYQTLYGQDTQKFDKWPAVSVLYRWIDFALSETSAQRVEVALGKLERLHGSWFFFETMSDLYRISGDKFSSTLFVENESVEAYEELLRNYEFDVRVERKVK